MSITLFLFSNFGFFRLHFKNVETCLQAEMTEFLQAKQEVSNAPQMQEGIPWFSSFVPSQCDSIKNIFIWLSFRSLQYGLITTP